MIVFDKSVWNKAEVAHRRVWRHLAVSPGPATAAGIQLKKRKESGKDGEGCDLTLFPLSSSSFLSPTSVWSCYLGGNAQRG